METKVIERRQHRRIALEVPVEIHALAPPMAGGQGAGQASHGSPSPRFSGRARDVSLAGLFVLMPPSFSLTPGSPVSCSVTIPPEHTKQFPFSRLIGKGWIVRVIPQPGEGGRAELGVAIAFTGDATALGTIPGY